MHKSMRLSSVLVTNLLLKRSLCAKQTNKLLVFRQLFDQNTFTYTYILGCPVTREAVIIDPVLEKVFRDLAILSQLDLKLKYAVNTHVHADHITGSGLIKKETNFQVKSVISKHTKAKADLYVHDGDVITFGKEKLECLTTPGHTNSCMTYVTHTGRMVFTGDALLIRGCGRTDFQEGNSSLLYDSIHKKIFKLPDDYMVFPGHDYIGQTVSSVGEEKKFNLRLNKPKDEFVQIMKDLKLAKPRFMDIAVPANLVCGLQEENKGN